MVLKICILRHPWMVFSSLFSYLVLKLHCWPNRLGEHLPPVPSLQMPVLSEYENFWKMTRKCKDPQMRGSPTRIKAFTHLQMLYLIICQQTRGWYKVPKIGRPKGEPWVEEAPASNPSWDIWAFQPISIADTEAEMCSPSLLTLLHKCHCQAHGLHECRRSLGHLLLNCLG